MDRPKNRDHGDWSSNVALKLAKAVGANPRELATEIAAGSTRRPASRASTSPDPASSTSASMRPPPVCSPRRSSRPGAAFGTNESQRGNTINVEFVSANPTGPLHIGHTRWAALGDSIARLLSASGATVAREFYINDAGAQMERFGHSVLAAIKGESTPEGGYAGSYIDDLARRVREAAPTCSSGCR